MKNLYNVKAFLLAFLVVGMSFLTSCNDDEGEMNSGQVELLSFGPTGAKHGEKIKFIGRNLDKVESIEMPGATLNRGDFTSQSSDLIELIIPQTATKGKVILKVAGGDEITSKTDLSFEVPVTISSFTSEARPGANVTITGNFLNWVDSVKVGNLTTNVTEFVSKSMTEVVFTVPMNAKTGPLTIYTGGTEPMTIVTEEDFVVTLPRVTAFSAASLKHGDNLTITGTDLDLVKEIRFVGVGQAVVSNFVSHTPSQIVVTVPNNASAGPLTLVTVNSLVEVPTTQTLSIILPAITTLAPNRVDPGASLTITGTNLDQVEEIEFTGGASTSAFTSKSATQIVLNVPMDALTGALTLVTQRNYRVKTSVPLTVIRARDPYFIYAEALHSEWQKWNGWGTTVQEMASTEQAFRGTRAIKISYNDNYGALQLHPTNPKVLEGYTTLVLNVYGVTGDYQMSVALQTKDGKDTPDGTFTLKQGEWKRIEIPISTFGDISAGINDFRIKNYGVNPSTVYIDDIELK